MHFTHQDNRLIVHKFDWLHFSTLDILPNIFPIFNMAFFYGLCCWNVGPCIYFFLPWLLLFSFIWYSFLPKSPPQSFAARAFTFTKHSVHISPVLQQLHWQLVSSRIKYKIILPSFKSLHDLAPSYLRELIHPYTLSCTLRSPGNRLLAVHNWN